MQTVRCTSNTTCFVLDTKNFERLVSKKNNPQTMDVMREYVKSKLHTRMNMRNADLIPLLGYLHQNLTEQLLPPTKKVSFMYSLWLILQTKKLSIGGPYQIEIVYWLLRAVNMTMRKPCSPPPSIDISLATTKEDMFKVYQFVKESLDILNNRGTYNVVLNLA